MSNNISLTKIAKILDITGTTNFNAKTILNKYNYVKTSNINFKIQFIPGLTFKILFMYEGIPITSTQYANQKIIHFKLSYENTAKTNVYTKMLDHPGTSTTNINEVITTVTNTQSNLSCTVDKTHRLGGTIKLHSMDVSSGSVTVTMNFSTNFKDLISQQLVTDTLIVTQQQGS